MAPMCGPAFRWIVLAASFGIISITDGYCYIYGVLKIHLEAEYPEYEPWVVSLIGGIVPFLFQFLAPVGLAVTEFFGPSRVVFTAGLISGAGFMLGWLNSFLQLGYVWDLITLGIVQGISSGLLYAPTIAVIPNYFPYHQRHFAAGFATCGSGFGAILFNFVIYRAIDAFGWRGAMLMLACISLQAVVFSMAFLESFKSPKEVVADVKNEITEEQKVDDDDDDDDDSDEDASSSQEPISNNSKASVNDLQEASAKYFDISIHHSNLLRRLFEERFHLKDITTHSLDNIISTRSNALVNTKKGENGEFGGRKEIERSRPPPVRMFSVPASGTRRTAPLHNYNRHNNNHNHIKPSYSRQTSTHTIQSSMWMASTIILEGPIGFRDILKKFFSTELLCQWSFLCLLCSAIGSILGYYVPLLFIPTEVEKPEWGVTPPVQQSMLFLVGIFNTLGRFVTGHLADYGTRWAICSSFSLFIIGQLIASAASLVFPFVMFLGNPSFIIFMAVYSLAIAPVITCRSLIARDLYGKDHANASFGWILSVQGIAQLFGYAIPTWLYKIDPFYPYLFGALCMLLSIVFVAMTAPPYFHARSQAKKEEAVVREILN